MVKFKTDRERSREAEERARKAGKKLLARMKGKGWKLRVWENLGWWHMVRLGTLQIHEHGGNYLASLGDEPKDIDCGSYVWHCESTMSDPNKLVARQLLIARKRVDQMNKIVTDLEAAIKA